MTIRDVTIKNPDRKWNRGREWRHARKSWGFWNLKKKKISWDLNSEPESWDSSLEKGSRFLVSARRDQLGSTKCAARDGVRWKSQHRKKLCVCLSLLMSKNLKLKKVIKSFVPEPISSVFGFLYVYEHLWTFSVSVWICLFHVFISWSYIFGRGPMLYITNHSVYLLQLEQLRSCDIHVIYIACDIHRKRAPTNLIIIILSRHQHGYPRPSLATPPYHSSLPVRPQGYTPYLHRAAVCRFELAALLLHGHMKGSIGVHHLWARPYFSSTFLYVWFV